MFRQWRRSVVHKKVRCPSYQIKRLDNGANFGSLRSPSVSAKSAESAQARCFISYGEVFLQWRNAGGFYSFALRTSAVATIKSRRSIKRQATNFRRLGRTSTPRGGERGDVCGKKRPLQNWRKAHGDISSRAENARKFFLTWETTRCRACRIIVLFNAMTGIFDGRISSRKK